MGIWVRILGLLVLGLVVTGLGLGNWGFENRFRDNGLSLGMC